MPATPRTHRWIWFFVILFVLAITATTVLIVFNLKQQLRTEQLQAARKLWNESGPKNYTLVYTTRVNEESREDEYWVKVREGRAVESKHNGQPEPPERLPYRGMEGLFDIAERFMKIDGAKDAPKTFVRAIFDDQKTGGLRWYVRRVMGTRQREEITVTRFTIDTERDSQQEK